MSSPLQKQDSQEIADDLSAVELVDINKDIEIENNFQKQLTQEIKTEKLKDKDVQLKEKGQTLIAISVDGSKHSEVAFNITTQEFLKENTKLLVIHVFNGKLDHLYNYKNKKETVIDDYKNKLYKYSKVSNFIVEDRTSKTHALEQVNKRAAHYKANFLVGGFYGIKGPKEDNKELSKGLDYLLAESKTPVIIIKDTPLRSQKKDKAYNWLFVFDKQYNNTIRTVETYLPLIDTKTDHVFGLTIMPANAFMDDVKVEFAELMEKNGIKNIDYECITASRSSGAIIADKVNFGDSIFDFVVFYNNREKYKNEAIKNDIQTMILKSKASICFLNN